MMAQLQVNVTDDPVELVFEDNSNDLKQPTDPLAKLLQENNLYDDLYDTLSKHGFDLDMLENDVKYDEIDAYSADFGFNSIRKAKFRKLMRIIARNDDRENEFKAQSNKDFYINLQIEQLKKDLSLVKKKTKLNEFKGKQDYDMDIALIGDMAVGKTSLIRRYVEDLYHSDSKSSIGLGHYLCYEELPDKKIMKVTIWDTAGQERYADVCSGCYKRADVILVCYDSDQSISLENCDVWRAKIEEYARKDNVFVILVACKTDLCNEENIQKAQMLLQQEKWRKFEAVHCHCSAKTGDNVRNVFLTAAEKIAKLRREDGKTNPVGSVLDDNRDASQEPQENKKCPCVVL